MKKQKKSIFIFLIITILIILETNMSGSIINLTKYISNTPQALVPTTTWKQNLTTVENGSVTLEVGTKVSGYEANGIKDWYILGAEGGRLLLTTNVNVENVKIHRTNSESQGVWALNTASQAYKNEELAYNARSINLNDINRVTGYNPSVHAVDYGKNYFFWYGNQVTYTKESGYIKLIGTKYPTTMMNSTNTVFNYPSSSETAFNSMREGESRKYTSTLYEYYPQTLSTTPSTETSINGSSKAYDLLFANTAGSNTNATSDPESCNCYWIAQTYYACSLGFITWRTFWSFRWNGD